LAERQPQRGQRRPLPQPRGRQLARPEPSGAQVVAAAGSAIVATAKVGRLLTRSGWGLARRLPGGAALQREVQRLQDAALHEVRRILDVPEGSAGAMSADEQRAVLLVQNSSGSNPLREAMTELLERSVETDRHSSRDYLYGNIISQLVPDEARILAALSDGREFAAVDVVAKQLGRSSVRPVLANASTVGRSAGVSNPDNVPTYVTRLHNFGLVEFGPPNEDLSTQYDILAADSAVQAAQATAESRRLGSPRLLRKTLCISPFGRDFWAATDPTGTGAGRR
jgi:hypothetical protein